MNFSCQTALFDLVVYLRDPRAVVRFFSDAIRGVGVRSGSQEDLSLKSFLGEQFTARLWANESERGGCTSAEVNLESRVPTQ